MTKTICEKDDPVKARNDFCVRKEKVAEKT